MVTISEIPRSMVGAVFSVLYVAIAIVLVAIDRKETGGGWITLHGMGSYLITLPISYLGEQLGMRPDYRRWPDMAFAIGCCAVIIYALGFALEKIIRLLLSGSPPG